MPRVVLVAAAALVAAACGGGGDSASDDSRRRVAPAKTQPTVLGLVFADRRAELRRLDALTLRAVGNARLRGLQPGMHSFAPDRKTLVLASGEGRPALRFVDARTLRLRGTLALRGPGWAGEFLWDGPERLTVVVHGPEPQVVSVDARAPRILRSQGLTGAAVSSDAGADRLAVLLAPTQSIGPASLAVIAADHGLVGIVELREIAAGSERIEHAEDEHAMRARSPAVAVSPDGARAVVVAAGSRVAEVDLDTLTVAYRDLSAPVSLLGRLRNWLEPTAHAKVVEGPFRDALWLGDHHVAVTGIDYRGIRNGDWDASPVGLRLIDTRDWSVRTLADHATTITRAGELVLAFGGSWPEGAPGTGVRAYGAGGRESFHALGSMRVGWVETSWPYGYVAHTNGRGQRFDVLDLRTGARLGTATTDRTVTILG